MANEIQITFNSVNLSSGDFTISNISEKLDNDLTFYNVPSTDGGIAEEAKKKQLIISVDGEVTGDNYDDLRSNLGTLKVAFASGKKQFTKDDDRYCNAQLQNFTYEYVTMRTYARYKASFLANYPFWLGASENSDIRTPTSGTGYTLTNNGNANARCKILVTTPSWGFNNNLQIENTTASLTCKYTGVANSADVVEFDNRYDTDDFEVLVTGVVAFKNFEGDFFYLEPGVNEIVYTGPTGASVAIYWRDTYL